MTDRTERRPSILGLAMLTGLLVLADGALASLGLVIWNAQTRDFLTLTRAATSILLGVSAALGALIYLLALLALARGPKTARLAFRLAVLRVIAVVVALVALAVVRGSVVLNGPLQSAGALVAVAEALGALIVMRVVRRRVGA